MSTGQVDSSHTGPSSPSSETAEAPAQSTLHPAGRRSVWLRLFDPVDNSWLVYFRILFGIEMLFTVYKHFGRGRVLWYSEAPFLFKYYGFEWAHALPGDLLKWHYGILGMLSLFIIVGFFYRLSMALFFFGFTYVFLLDQADYLNHYYLVCLIALVMIFIPANQRFSVDSLLSPKKRSATAPLWALWMLRIQIGIPYFFGGIAKINLDWLRCEPMHMWLIEKMDNYPLMADFFQTWEAAFFFSYGGLFYDLMIVPMLIWHRTRMLGYGMTVFFHMTNTMLFSIGIFPWLMMLATLIFFPPDVPRRFLSKLVLLKRPTPPETAPESDRLTRHQKTVLAVAGVYLAFQVLFPLRHWLYPGNVSWNEDGHRFAWHMMLRSKRGFANFYAHDPTTGKSFLLDPTGYLSMEQTRDMSGRPDMIRQFAEFMGKDPKMRKEYDRVGMKQVEIHVDSWVSLNGRMPQHLIDPEVDLSREPRTIFSKHWVVPLTQPFRAEPFGVQHGDWEKFLETLPSVSFDESVEITD